MLRIFVSLLTSRRREYSDEPRLCMHLILWVCLSVRTIKTKTAETRIAKLGTGIVHHDISPTNYPIQSNFICDTKQVKMWKLGLILGRKSMVNVTGSKSAKRRSSGRRELCSRSSDRSLVYSIILLYWFHSNKGRITAISNEKYKELCCAGRVFANEEEHNVNDGWDDMRTPSCSEFALAFFHSCMTNTLKSYIDKLLY